MYWSFGHTRLRKLDVTAGFYQVMLFIYKWSRLCQKIKCNPHDLLWNEKTTLCISSSSLEKKDFLWNTNFKISGLTIAPTLPHWLSCVWENKATHGFKKRFLQCLPSSLSYIYMFVHNTVLPYKWYVQELQVFWHWWLPRNSPKPLHLKPLLSFRWRKRNIFVVVVVLLLLFFPQMFSNQSWIRYAVSQSILQIYSEIIRKNIVFTVFLSGFEKWDIVSNYL